MRGDCGTPLIVNETKVLRKIAGIHVAGSRDGLALSESITQCDLDRVFRRMTAEKNIVFDPDDAPNFTPVPAIVQIGEYYTEDELVRQTGLPGKNFNLIGAVSRVPFVPAKTTLRKSLICGDVTEPMTVPSCLKSTTDVNIYKKNIEKFSTLTPYIEGNMLDACVKDVSNVLLSGKRDDLARVFTVEEAIRGSDVSNYISPIDRSTSPGYPWLLNKQSGKVGKRTWLGDVEYDIDPTVYEAVNERINRARLGHRTPVIWTDTLKDERRPIEKVKAMKTRIFAYGPMDYTIAFRMYFIGFQAHIMENRIFNEQSLGTNVKSHDWGKTAKYLSSKGPKVIAGDFSCFDGTLNSGIMSRYVEVANAFYDDGPENALIREVLFKEVYNSVHMSEGLLYGMNHSQPSGNPSTTCLNSFYNSVSMRMVYLLCARDAGLRRSVRDFRDEVAMVSYGDDNVINFRDSISDWFNQHTITKAYSDIGMTYTDEAKTGGDIPKYRNIHEVAYLKRSFVKRGQMWIAPLDLATCLEMCNWRRDSVDALAATQVNCETAIRELACHPKEIFDEYANKIEKAFYNRTKRPLTTYTFEELNEEMKEEYYL
jgi:hypothetical protein